MSAIATEAEVVRDEVDDAMDAIALNHMQGQAILNPDPEVNSGIERVRLLRTYPVPADLIDRLEADLWLLAELNGRERQLERRIAGRLEGVAARLRVLSHGAGRARVLAPKLRGPLDGLLPFFDGRGGNPADYLPHVAALFAVLQRVSPRTLASRQMRTELGPRKHELLCQLVGIKEPS